MSSLFSGLDAFGMDDIDKSDLFEEKGSDEKVDKSLLREITEESLLYSRTIRCPVCGSVF